MHVTGIRLHEHLSSVIYLSHVAVSTGAGDLPHDLRLVTVIIVCDVQLLLDFAPRHLFKVSCRVDLLLHLVSHVSRTTYLGTRRPSTHLVSTSECVEASWKRAGSE